MLLSIHDPLPVFEHRYNLTKNDREEPNSDRNRNPERDRQWRSRKGVRFLMVGYSLDDIA